MSKLCEPQNTYFSTLHGKANKTGIQSSLLWDCFFAIKPISSEKMNHLQHIFVRNLISSFAAIHFFRQATLAELILQFMKHNIRNDECWMRLNCNAFQISLYD